ncbi:DUF1203 domain-containing protein [Kitasatospora camelliae]|uniref:DUF1203 domain-containing protein n=1 Tax=Kitasatospora camelliae TaxID=3156397 RepID=A0AAU8JZ56_9ACTN
MNALDIRAIPAEVLDTLRTRDDAGRPPVLLTDEEGGSPLRCCLGRARPGERIALLTYAPLRRWAAETGADPGPYDEQGPVFVHADPCAGPTEPGWPGAMHAGQRVLRAYDARGHILDGTLVTPDTAESTARDLLADPGTAFLHIRALSAGCFLHAIHRG